MNVGKMFGSGKAGPSWGGTKSEARRVPSPPTASRTNSKTPGITGTTPSSQTVPSSTPSVACVNAIAAQGRGSASGAVSSISGVRSYSQPTYVNGCKVTSRPRPARSSAR